MRNATSGRATTLDDGILSNLGFVCRVARRYAGLGVPIQDLTHDGVVGLVEARRRFEAGRGACFLTYASWWIRKRIAEAVQEGGRVVRIPDQRERELRRALEVERTLASELFAMPGAGDVSARLGRSADSVRRVLQLRRHVISLDDPIPDRGGLRLSDGLVDRGNASPEDRLIRAQALELLRRALPTLPERQRRVLSCRFGLDGGPALTLVMTGRRLGLSGERARQIEYDALERLRAAFGAKRTPSSRGHRGDAASRRRRVSSRTTAGRRSGAGRGTPPARRRA